MPRLSNIIGRYVYVSVDDVEYRVYYEEAEGAAGMPVLCQHTAGADGRQWRHQLEDPEIASRYRLVAYDLPYHGKSVPPPTVEWWKQEYALHQDWFMRFVVAMRRTLELEGAVYMGCSMGGHLAPDLALHYPGEFKAVIAVEGGLATHVDEPFLKYLHHPRVSNELKGALMYTMTSPTSPEALRRETGWVYSQGAPPVFKGDLVYYLGEHDLTDDAKDIDTSRTAVYVISGDYDWSADPTVSRALADAIPGATYTPMNGLGHFPMSEDPLKFKGYLLPILEKVAGA
ncbi:MAG: alpha/beta hydrolase [Acidimicrobiaceae bacterium]|nr:alpha/beta hydrolase [Acidimicrobiaceae bacterium]